METALPALWAISSLAWLVIVAATAWVGARVRARGDAEAGVRYAARFAALSKWVAIPAALLALAFGIAAVQSRGFSIDPHWWVGTALGAWIVAFLGSTLMRGALLAKAVEVARSVGADAEDVRWRIRQVTLVSRGELVLLLATAAVVALQPDAPL